MLTLKLSKQAETTLRKIPKKHARQIAERLKALRSNLDTVQSSELKGYPPFRRVRAGDYRIIFFVENQTVFVPLIGKRNDDEIYRLVRRFMR